MIASKESPSSNTNVSTEEKIDYLLFGTVGLVVMLGTSTFVYIFPFIGYLVTSLGDWDTATAGYVSGFILSCLFVFQMIYASRWGRASDEYRKKPVLLSGVAAVGALVAMFGFTRSIWWAILARSLIGVFSSNMANCKALLLEACKGNQKMESKAASFIGINASLGAIMGPIVGGTFYYPCSPNSPIYKYQWFDDESLFCFYRPLLPCTILAVFATIVFTLGYFYLPDIDKDTAKPFGFAEWLGVVVSPYHDLKALIFGTGPSAGKGNNNGDGGRNNGGGNPSKTSNTVVRASDKTGATAQQDEVKNSSFVVGASPTSSDCPRATLIVEEEEEGEASDRSKEPLGQERSRGDDHVRKEAQTVGVSAPSSAEKTSDKGKKLTMGELWKYPMIRASIFGLIGVSAGNIGFAEVWPLFAIAPKDRGGMEWAETDIAIYFAVANVASLFTNILFSFAVGKFGRVQLFRRAAMIWMPLQICFPMLSMVPSHSYQLKLALALGLMRNIVTTFLFQVSTLFLSASSPKGCKGLVQGLAQSIAAVSRLTMPMSMAPVFAWSISTPPHSFPFNHYFAFLILVAVIGYTFLTSYRFTEEKLDAAAAGDHFGVRLLSATKEERSLPCSKDNQLEEVGREGEVPQAEEDSRRREIEEELPS